MNPQQIELSDLLKCEDVVGKGLFYMISGTRKAKLTCLIPEGKRQYKVHGFLYEGREPLESNLKFKEDTAGSAIREALHTGRRIYAEPPFPNSRPIEIIPDDTNTNTTPMNKTHIPLDGGSVAIYQTTIKPIRILSFATNEGQGALIHRGVRNLPVHTIEAVVCAAHSLESGKLTRSRIDLVETNAGYYEVQAHNEIRIPKDVDLPAPREWVVVVGNDGKLRDADLCFPSAMNNAFRVREILD